mgnify:CR=1 FL=1|jgi:hypothetical protein
MSKKTVTFEFWDEEERQFFERWWADQGGTSLRQYSDQNDRELCVSSTTEGKTTFFRRDETIRKMGFFKKRNSTSDD